MTAKHFGIMECAFFNRHGYAGVGPAYVDVGKEGVEWGLKGGRSFSLRQSCNTHTCSKERWGEVRGFGIPVEYVGVF